MATEFSEVRKFSRQQKSGLTLKPPPSPKRNTNVNVCWRTVSVVPCLVGKFGYGSIEEEPTRQSAEWHRRIRSQVGITNRWRLPQTSAGADLLGCSQASKAFDGSESNESLLSHMTSGSARCQSARGDRCRSPFLDSVEQARVTSCKQNGRSGARSHMSNAKKINYWLNNQPKPTSAHKLAQKPSKKDVSALLASMPYNPLRRISVEPQDLFLHLTDRYGVDNPPDVYFYCLDIKWGLHARFLLRSITLKNLLMELCEPCRDACASEMEVEYASNSSSEVGSAVDMRLDVEDEAITPLCLAVVLGNLYRENIELTSYDLPGVFRASRLLGFLEVERLSVALMRAGISKRTVGSSQAVAIDLGESDLLTACNSWLELNLVPKLAKTIHLRTMTKKGLETILASPRLFTDEEYSLYRLLCTNIYLNFCPHVQYIPPFANVMTYFISFPKSSSFLETEYGKEYINLFSLLRLHTITECDKMSDMQAMNVLPGSWLVKMFADNYNSINSGGDMGLLVTFHADAIRTGFIINEQVNELQKRVSVFGFDFALVSARHDDHYFFYIQRLSSTDVGSAAERRTFSKRRERIVHYSITVQWLDYNGVIERRETGMKSKRFGSSGESALQSHVFQWCQMKPPLYVTFSLLFPPS